MDTRIKLRVHAKLARWIGIVLIVAIIGAGLSLFGGGNAYAAKQPLDIAIEHGFDGKMKDGKWFPVKVTITNPGDDLSGDLTIRMTADNGKDVLYAKHVDLPRQTTKIIWFTLPGKHLNATNNVVAFYEKSVDKGSQIPFAQGKVSIETKPASQETIFVGIVARDPDTLNFLSLLNQKGYSVQTTPISVGDFPWEPAMLDSIDVLAFNDAATDSLKPEQVKEIEAWVTRGGKLLLAGGAAYPKTAAAFASLSPVTANGTTTVSSFKQFVDATGKELALSSPFTVSRATAKSGEIVFEENGIPLVVNAPFGQGATTYVAYDLAMQPIASWSGNATVWERILFENAALAGNNGQKVRYDNGLWELNNALEVFPQLIPPALGILTLLFLAYTILVAPVLYVLLKKVDRREWSWFIIPSIAVVSSLIIYGLGASGRGSTLAQTLGINELSGSGTSTRTAASSVFVPSGGDYELEWSGKRNISPMMLNNGSRIMQIGEADMTVRSEPDKTVVAFANVPFWSVRKAYDTQEVVVDSGKFDYTIRFDTSGAKGDVTNNTKYDLYEAGLVVGGQWFRLGDMKPGEKKQFQMSLGNSVAMRDPQWGSFIFPYSGNRDIMQRERSLLNSFSQKKWNDQANGRQIEPYIIGFAKSNGNLFKIDGANVQSERIDLFVQQIKPDYVQGDRLFIPGGVIVPYMDSSNASYIGGINNGVIDMGMGDMTLMFRLPNRPEWRYEKLTLATAAQPQFKLELWNEKKQSWESLQGGQAVELNADQIEQSLTPGNGIRLKVTNSQNGRFAYPVMSAEGVVKR